jgi:UDP-glucose 4-epimerase
VHTSKKIIVTGGRGAIGRHIVSLAKSQGYFVMGLGHGAWSGDGGLPEIDCWLNGDITYENLNALSQLVGSPDAIIHLAGGSHVGASITQPSEDFQRTVGAARALFDWVRNISPTTKIVIASSAAVYGAGHDGPIDEGTGYAPASPYGTHKAMVEVMARGYARQFELPMAILRIFSAYGPELRKQLIWEMTNRLIRGERKITLGGTGNERRDFISLADTAGMLLRAIDLADGDSPVINCCSGEATAIREVVGLIASQFDEVDFAFSGDVRVGDPVNLVGDAKLARSVGLFAPTDFKSGLLETVQWIKSNSEYRGTPG